MQTIQFADQNLLWVIRLQARNIVRTLIFINDRTYPSCQKMKRFESNALRRLTETMSPLVQEWELHISSPTISLFRLWVEFLSYSTNVWQALNIIFPARIWLLSIKVFERFLYKRDILLSSTTFSLSWKYDASQKNYNQNQLSSQFWITIHRKPQNFQ